MRIFVSTGLAFLAASFSGCLYANVREPLAYRSPTPADVGGNVGQEVKGESCNHVILWLFAFGDGGYDAAVKDARESAHAALLADMKADISLLNVISTASSSRSRPPRRSSGARRRTTSRASHPSASSGARAVTRPRWPMRSNPLAGAGSTTCARTSTSRRCSASTSVIASKCTPRSARESARGRARRRVGDRANSRPAGTALAR